MKLIKVAAHSRVAAVAGAIAGIIRDHCAAEIQAIGAPAVNQMVKAIITARRSLSDDGLTTTSCEPSFVELDIDGAERTAIRFSIAVVGERREATSSYSPDQFVYSSQ